MNMAKKSGMWKNILLFLSVVGPGIITANVDNDAGGITTYSVAGASFGYKFLWTFIPMIIALIIVQEMGVRMGAVTGKGLADLIRERYGVKITLLAMLGLVLTAMGNTLAEFAGVAASMEVFGISKYLSVPVAAIIVWWLVVKGSYSRVEKIFLFASALYLCYIVSGVLAQPPWGEVLKETVTPHFSFESGYISMMIGMVGTTIAPWMQFYIQSSVVEKGITAEEYKLSRIDVIFGCFMVNIVALFIVVACAATLYKNGVTIETAKDAAMSLQPLAGPWASELFAFGLFNASLFAASILPLSTAYLICEALGFEAGVDKTWSEAPIFYWLYTLLIVLGAGLILIPELPLITIMLWSQVINGILLPFVLIFMLEIINDKDIMGEYTNSKIFNMIAWITTIIMIGLTTLLVLSSIFPNLLS
ncbi:natural resistance-associated macrophage protein [Desulfofarcimen acetoxidans DSM 771]|uniref:Natural resistance-associated macrophage protein n=1 Tax=Desulfofarcimen acetoxidans (strain ATCC 49208 / DSM 771 / KCTC 5769 / VKM B-1644 / 5575) TaxID=485916 RepID=C8VX20_DESAS|nr:Nramp family divalent metal transporter [Desulfofarcimen acetoxidans]ACV62596.1 natural resistance-associated macrophage protein [Desulfofarcimen acetoxidans DSM 771]